MAVASIVDYLKSRKMDSSFGARKVLAGQNGITGYSGTAKQNTALLNILQKNGAAQQDNVTITPVGSSGNGDNVIITPVSSSEPSQTGTPGDYLTGYKYSRFSTSGRTQDYEDKLHDLEDNKPADYTSKYQGTIDSLIDSILNRKDFDTNEVYDSDLYKNYRDQYIQQGQKAMRDTIGAASAATGGYGSTYATAAGQQAYDSYLSQLNDRSLDIYDRVYQKYLNEGQELYNRLGMVNNQDSIDYGRYRDTVNDYYNDLNYYAGRYDSSYNQDFGEWQSDLSAQQWAEQYAYQKTQDALAQKNWQTQFDYQKEQDALDMELKRQQLAASLSRKSSGSSGTSSGGKKSTSEDLSSYVADAQKLYKAKDGHGLNYYDDSYIIEYLADKYPSLTDSQMKKVITEAGGDYDKGLRTLKKIIEED